MSSERRNGPVRIFIPAHNNNSLSIIVIAPCIKFLSPRVRIFRLLRLPLTLLIINPLCFSFFLVEKRNQSANTTKATPLFQLTVRFILRASFFFFPFSRISRWRGTQWVAGCIFYVIVIIQYANSKWNLTMHALSRGFGDGAQLQRQRFLALYVFKTREVDTPIFTLHSIISFFPSLLACMTWVMA